MTIPFKREPMWEIKTKTKLPLRLSYSEFYKLKKSLLETEITLKKEGRKHEAAGVRRARLRLQRVIRKLAQERKV